MARKQRVRKYTQQESDLIMQRYREGEERHKAAVREEAKRLYPDRGITPYDEFMVGLIMDAEKYRDDFIEELEGGEGGEDSA